MLSIPLLLTFPLHIFTSFLISLLFSYPTAASSPQQSPLSAQAVISSNPPPKIRPATQSDIDAITDIIVDAFDPSAPWKYVYQFKDVDSFHREYHWGCVREAVGRELFGLDLEEVSGKGEGKGMRDQDGDERELWVNVIDAPDPALDDDESEDRVDEEEQQEGEEAREEDKASKDLLRQGVEGLDRLIAESDKKRKRKRRTGPVSLAAWNVLRRNTTSNTTSSFSHFLNSPLLYNPLVHHPIPEHKVPNPPIQSSHPSNPNCSLHLDTNHTRLQSYSAQVSAFQRTYVEEAYDAQLYLAMLATHPDFDGRGYAAAQLRWGKELARNLSGGSGGGRRRGGIGEKTARGEHGRAKSGNGEGGVRWTDSHQEEEEIEEVETARTDEQGSSLTQHAVSLKEAEKEDLSLRKEQQEETGINITLIATPAGWELYHTVEFEEVKNLTWRKVGGGYGGWFEVMFWRVVDDDH